MLPGSSSPPCAQAKRINSDVIYAIVLYIYIAAESANRADSADSTPLRILRVRLYVCVCCALVATQGLWACVRGIGAEYIACRVRTRARSRIVRDQTRRGA